MGQFLFQGTEGTDRVYFQSSTGETNKGVFLKGEVEVVIHTKGVEVEYKALDNTVYTTNYPKPVNKMNHKLQEIFFQTEMIGNNNL